MTYRFDVLIEWSDWTAGREEHARSIAGALRRLVGSRFKLRNLHLITSASSGPAVLDALRTVGVGPAVDGGASESQTCRRIVPWLKPTGGLLSLRPDGEAMPEFVRVAVNLASLAGQGSDVRFGLDLETWLAPYYTGAEDADWRTAGDNLASALDESDVDGCFVLQPTIQDHLPLSEDIRAGFFGGTDYRATRGLICIDPWDQWSRAKNPQPESWARWTTQNRELGVRDRLQKRMVRPVSERADWKPSQSNPWYADEAITLCESRERQLFSLPADPAKLDEACATMAELKEAQ